MADGVSYCFTKCGSFLPLLPTCSKPFQAENSSVELFLSWMPVVEQPASPADEELLRFFPIFLAYFVVGKGGTIMNPPMNEIH